MRPPGVLALLLLGWSAVANLLIGDRFYVERNLTLAAALLAAARWGGVSEAELGLQRSRLVSGLRWGMGAVGVVALVLVLGVALAGSVPPIATLLADERAAAATDELVYVTLVRIPFGTALFEEIAFRGVLFGWLLRATTTRRAVVLSSVVFGLWHIPPTLVTLSINGVAGGSGEGIVAMVGAVLVTGVAGALFCWLRLRSGSLAAPVLAHWATNSLGLLAAVITRGSVA